MWTTFTALFAIATFVAQAPLHDAQYSDVDIAYGEVVQDVP